MNRPHAISAAQDAAETMAQIEQQIEQLRKQLADYKKEVGGSTSWSYAGTLRKIEMDLIDINESF